MFSVWLMTLFVSPPLSLSLSLYFRFFFQIKLPAIKFCGPVVQNLSTLLPPKTSTVCVPSICKYWARSIIQFYDHCVCSGVSPNLYTSLRLSQSQAEELYSIVLKSSSVMQCKSQWWNKEMLVWYTNVVLGNEELKICLDTIRGFPHSVAAWANHHSIM